MMLSSHFCLSVTLLSVLFIFQSFALPAASVKSAKDWQTAKNWGSGDPEVDLDTIGIIKHWGYPAERHHVTTPDGYILELHRIPYGKKSGPGTNKPVIYMQHGLEASSSNWITNMPWQSAGFLFADAGFDVWMGNFRGNTYSRSHVSLSPDQDAFWAFSFDEMGTYDLPTMIDYVLANTSQQDLYYMGHSEGTMAMFVRASLDETMLSKVKLYFALAPVGNLTHMGGLISYIAPYTNDLEYLLKLIGGYNEFLPSDALTHLVAKYMCGWSITDVLCSDLLFLLVGGNSHQLNAACNAKQFQAFDWGSPAKNSAHYNGDIHPPVYNLRHMKLPTYIFAGELDVLADPKDVAALEQVLPNIVESHHLNDFNHMDFIWGENAVGEVYEPILDIIKADLRK